MPKLFQITYMDDCDDCSYLTVGESEDAVKEREYEKLKKSCSCLMGAWIREITQVDGHRITVE